MELNYKLSSVHTETHTLKAMTTSADHNLIALDAGMCHEEDFKVFCDGVELLPAQFLGLLPSGEFRARYNIPTFSAVMILDNTLSGTITIESLPIGGPYQNINYNSLSDTGAVVEYYGYYLEEFGSVIGLEDFNREAGTTPSRASDISAIQYGRTSHPSATDPT